MNSREVYSDLQITNKQKSLHLFCLANYMEKKSREIMIRLLRRNLKGDILELDCEWFVGGQLGDKARNNRRSNTLKDNFLERTTALGLVKWQTGASKKEIKYKR